MLQTQNQTAFCNYRFRASIFLLFVFLFAVAQIHIGFITKPNLPKRMKQRESWKSLRKQQRKARERERQMNSKSPRLGPLPLLHDVRPPWNSNSVSRKTSLCSASHANWFLTFFKFTRALNSQSSMLQVEGISVFSFEKNALDRDQKTNKKTQKSHNENEIIALLSSIA